MDLRGVAEFFKDISKYLIVIVIVILLFVFIVGIQQVVGPSMESTLNQGDVVIINKLIYKNVRGIKRNDIVIIQEEEKNMIKRIIGMPGDNIEYKDNFLYINGEKYKESFLKDEVITEDFKLSDIGYEKIPDGYYLVLGDNRENSKDSRDFGLVNKKDIVGLAWIRIYPFNKIKFIK